MAKGNCNENSKAAGDEGQMTKLLFLEDCYLKEFDAKVARQGKDYVVLDKTAFYPLGGGQPADTGTLNGVQVTDVRKEKGEVRHFAEPLIVGDVHGVLDWEQRYARMRMHTAQHLLSALILDKYGSETVGNQIHEEKSRMDFFPFTLAKEEMSGIVGEFNKAVDEKHDVKIYFTTREDVLAKVDERRRKLFERIPQSVKKVRMVEIVGIDLCPCAGTHVKSLGEIGHVEIQKVESKGKGIKRVTFGLVL